MTSYAKIRPRRSSTSEWELTNPILLEGEIGVEYPDSGIGSDLVKMKIGDGITSWNDLGYAVDCTSASSIYGGDSTASKDIWLRTDSHDRWLQANPILGIGEIIFDSTYRAFKVGDGIHEFNELNFIGGDVEDPDIDWNFGDEDEAPNDSDIDEDFGDEDFIG